MRRSRITGAENIGDSTFASDLATVARSVLIQYGLGGTVGQVTPGERASRWQIEVVGLVGCGPITLDVTCSEGTPTYIIRSAISNELEART
jgi:hypothetical protein